MESVGITAALTDFLKWLKTFHNVVLVAHNDRKNDFVVLSSALMNCGLVHDYLSVVSALADSMTVSKCVMDDQKSFTQENLAKTF